MFFISKMFLVDKFTSKQVDETEMSCKLYISYVTCLVYSLLVYLFMLLQKLKLHPTPYAPFFFVPGVSMTAGSMRRLRSGVMSNTLNCAST